MIAMANFSAVAELIFGEPLRDSPVSLGTELSLDSGRLVDLLRSGKKGIFLGKRGKGEKENTYKNCY